MSINELAWRLRGRALYAVPGSAVQAPVLSLPEARKVVARRLRTSLQGLAEREYDAAVDAAARGFLRAHRACGLYVRRAPVTDLEPPPGSAERPSAPPPGFLEELLAALGNPHLDPLPPRGLTPPVAVTFTITQHHALTRALGGGRVRIQRGESAMGAVVRRICRDTRCEVVEVREEPEADSAGRHFRITLRGTDGRGPRCRIIEGAIQVRI